MKKEKFEFLEEESRFYEVNVQKNHTVYQYKEGEKRGIIGVPKNENSYFWFKYFVKGDKESYKNGIPEEAFPEWFKQLTVKAGQKVEQRDRVRKMFKSNYQNSTGLTKS